MSINNAGMANSTAVDFPIFSAWLAKETGDVGEVLQAAFQVRNEPEFAEAREQLRAIRNAFDGDDIATANVQIRRIVSELAKVSAYIRDKYGIQTQQGIPVTRLVHVYNTYAALNGFPVLPDYDFKIKLPGFIRDLARPSGFSAIYRNISNDLSSVWALGEARDILGARVIKEKDAVAYNPKSEAPEYRHAHSPFKSPM